MYALNNPINYVDNTGKSASTILFTTAGGAAIADGPLPFGDGVALVLVTAGGITLLVETLTKDHSTNRNRKEQKAVLYHYGYRKHKSSIMRNGFWSGTYATDNPNYSPSEAVQKLSLDIHNTDKMGMKPNMLYIIKFPIKWFKSGAVIFKGVVEPETYYGEGFWDRKVYHTTGGGNEYVFLRKVKNGVGGVSITTKKIN